MSFRSEVVTRKKKVLVERVKKYRKCSHLYNIIDIYMYR